ncbi:MAG: DUF4406 domain-containing protein [Methylobacter sp.]|nr:DUF4406 domain-containing protein [Methylobacter sp.]
MIIKKIYDILELHALEPAVRNALALSYGVDTENKKKQEIMYAILDAQSQWNNSGLPGKETDGHPSLLIELTISDKKRVYLIAKVSGLPESEVTAKYEKARKLVESYGYEAVIPTDIIPPNTNWHYAMRQLIPIMLQCDAYTLIDEPCTTAGGLVEDTIANWVQLPKLMFSKL